MLEKYIIPCFGGLKLYEIDKDSPDTLIKKNMHLSQKSLRDITTLFKTIIKFANKYFNFNIQLNEYRFKKSDGKKITVFSVQEQEKIERYLLNETDLSKMGILLCLYTGLRIGEICALQWGDIDFESETVKISKTIQRIKNTDNEKTDKTKIIIDKPKTDDSMRIIPLPDFIIKLLKENRKSYEKNSYFLTGNFNYVEPRTYQYRFKKYLENAGVNNLNFHALRHTFATRAVEQEVDIKTLSEILGHSSVNITLEKYVHSSIEQKRRQINKLKSFAIM